MKDIVKKFTWRRVLAVIFLLLVFSISGAELLIMIKRSKNILSAGLVKFKQWIDSQYTQMLVFRGPVWVNKGAYISLNGLLANILGKRVVNDVVKMNNGHLTGFIAKEDFSRYGETLKTVKSFLDKRNIYCLYVQAPYKVCKYDSQLPAEIANYANENADEFLKMVQDIGFNIFDLHEEMHRDGMDHYNAFYKTDLHWKHETAFWANRKILEYLKTENIVDMQHERYLNSANYNIENYKNLFLGNYGKRTGRYFGGLDDINIILPKNDPGSPLAGVAEDTYFDRTKLAKDYYGGEQYNWTYLSEGFENTEAAVQKKVLLLADSFVNSMHFFMNMNVRQVEYINVWYYPGRLFEYIENYQPDIIIILYTPSTLELQLSNLEKNISVSDRNVR